MIQKRRVFFNTLTSVVQVVVNGLTFLLLYRFLYATVPVSALGVWSVVLAWTSVTYIANLGMAGSAVKYVSMYRARGEHERVADVVQTALLSVGALLALVLLVAYPVLRLLLHVVIQPASSAWIAYQLLPFAFVSFWISGQLGVLQSCIDGFQRVDLRNLIAMGAALLYLLFAWWLVPTYGIMGLAWAQIGQGLCMAAACWAVLKVLHRELPLAPYRWSQPVFKEMLGYNVQFQVLSLAQMLFDPTAKALMARIGGTTAAGYMDGASKLAMQLRAVVVAAHQSLIPTIADVQERAPEYLRTIYVKSFQIVFFLFAGLLPLLLALVPVFSELLIKRFEPAFAAYTALMLVGWFMNLLGNAAFFNNMGTGQLKWNVVTQFAGGVINLVAGGLLGLYLGGIGVILGYVAALTTTSLILATTYQREHRIRWADLIEPASVWLIGTGLAAAGASLWVDRRLLLHHNLIARIAAILAVYGAAVAIPLWRHPLRAQITGWLTAALAQRASRSPAERP